MKPKAMPAKCPLCNHPKLKAKITTYPTKYFDGKQLNIARVAVHECLSCHHLIPTKAGAEKIHRCFASMATLFRGI